ncbi:hypothetical protein EGW08_002586 [Elysia chlorotica]|uniref:Cytochrome P450 n=1 Tax=Elysia chlorotica TaxID=188477 RepID=A0A3S0ZZ47_ELYCH|nr:hypothetical protein EGW08_002586 [Elysia chlorotica]
MSALLLGFDLPALLLGVAAALIVTLVLKSWGQTPANLPPFPGRRVPIFGHLLVLGSEAREKLLEIRKTTGDIFSMYFGGTLIIVLSGLDVLKEALVKQGDVFVDRPVGGFSRTLKIQNGIIGTSGSIWKENRFATFHILKGFGLGKDVMSQKIVEEINLYLKYLEGLSGEATNVQDITTCAASNVTCKIVFGKRFEYDDTKFIGLLLSLNEYMTLIGGGNFHTLFPFVKYLPGDLSKTKRLVQLDREISGEMRHFIKEIREQERDGLASSNLVTSYIERMEEKQKSAEHTELSLYHLDRIAFDLFVGGTETSSTTLLWFYLYMIHFPDIQEKVYEEIVREIGTDRCPTGQDKVGLPYTNAVIYETQRLASISPLGVIHRCNKETTIAGYTIPKDVPIITHLDAVMRDDKIWGDANVFDQRDF